MIALTIVIICFWCLLFLIAKIIGLNKRIDKMIYLSRNGWIIRKNSEGKILASAPFSGFEDYLNEAVEEQESYEIKVTKEKRDVK